MALLPRTGPHPFGVSGRAAALPGPTARRCGRPGAGVASPPTHYPLWSMTRAIVETHLRPVDNQDRSGCHMGCRESCRLRGRVGVVEVAETDAGLLQQVFDVGDG